MITVAMKPLLEKLNEKSAQILHNAAGLTVSRTHYEVGVEHLFIKALEDAQSDLSLACRAFKIDAGALTAALNDALEDYKSGNSGKPVFSPVLIELLEDAWLVASVDLGEARIRTGALLLAFLSRPKFYSPGRWSETLAGINREEFAKSFYQVVQGSGEQQTVAGAAAVPGQAGEAGAGTPGGQSFIARFCQDFTARAQEGKIDPVFGRDAEIRQIVDILARRRKNNPILVGDPGVGKTAVMEGLALRITQGDVPDVIKNCTLLGLDMGALEAGAGMKGEFENRLRGVLTEIKSSVKPIILFIDEAHTLVGAGGQAGGSDAANLLKPALARGELKTCAATTWAEYKKYFEKDPALARRFQLVKLDEPSVETAALILRGLRDSYEAAHKVIVRDDAMDAAAEMSGRYIQGRFLPDKAIDLLDTACARVKVSLAAKPGALEDLERALQANERKHKALDRDIQNGVVIDQEAYEADAAKAAQLTTDIEAMTAEWTKELEAAKAVLAVRAELAALDPAAADFDAQKTALLEKRSEADAALKAIQGDAPKVFIEVGPDVVAQVVADWTGIPVGKVAREQAQTVLDLDARLKERVKGQDAAIEAVSAVIRAAKSGLKDPSQPLGVFLLVGPSGVGKTETGLSLADVLFGDERSVVTINMSEFQEKHTLSRLIGSPPGYVGYGEGGMLTEAVRKHPYCVVLLDEVEKASLDVMNLFYQVFDKGMLTDGEGKEINFRNTIIILTSNLASDVIQEMTRDADLPGDALVQAVRPILSQHFKPALLARMTICPYVSLKGEAMKRIVELKLSKLARAMRENRKMTLVYGQDVVDAVAARCTETETGARNIDAILNGSILPRMSREILAHMAGSGMPSKTTLGIGPDGDFSLEFS